MKKNTVININGYNLETDDVIYEVVPRFDANAPDGLKQLKTTKFLNKDFAINTHCVGYNRDIRLWDTGLYKESPMYAGLNPDEVERRVKQIQKLIVEPFEKTYGPDPETGKSRLDHTNENSKFWNRVSESSFKVRLFNGRLFNTNKPDQLLELFIAISSGFLSPKEIEESPEFLSAQFSVENKENVKTTTQENDMLEVKTLGAFANLLGKKKNLNLVLNYVGINVPSKFNESLITSQFKRWVDSKEHSHQNRKIFLEAVEKSETPKGYKELNYYKVLQDFYRQGVVKKEFENFLIDGEVLGNGSLKTCAENVIKDKGLETKVMDHMK